MPPDLLQRGGNTWLTPNRPLQHHSIHSAVAYRVPGGDESNDIVSPTDGESLAESFKASTTIQNVLLPPSTSNLSAQIIHDTATITITHSFENKSTVHLQQGSYQFPLPHTAAVVDFTCRIGDSTTLRGTVKSKEEAKRMFRNAVRRSRPAGLLAQDGSPEIFKMRIGNIPAGARVVAKLTIILLLKHDFIEAKSVTQITLSIPTYIAPRYGAAPTGVLETGPRGTETTISVEVEVLSAENIIEIHSDTHRIYQERGAGRRKCQRWAEFLAPQQPSDSTSAMVRLAEGIACLDRDFVLSIVTRPIDGAENPVACLETHPSLANHGALMITLPPQFMLRHTASTTNNEIIFLADRSGSMDDKITGLKSAMEFFVRGIPAGRLFNIWCFGSSYTSLWTKSRALDQDTMTEALRYVSGSFSADMGGTELLPAIQAVVDARDEGRAMDVVVLTDGEVWRLEETISFVQSSRASGNTPVRYFALGIGNAVSRALVEGIANAGGGYAEFIPIAANGGWEDRLVAVLSAALTGHCGRISVELDTVSQEALDKQTEKPPAIQTTLRDASGLSPFVRNRIFYLFEGGLAEPCRSVMIKTKDVYGSELRKTIPILPLRDKDLKLHRFAVQALLGDLEHRLHETRNPKRSGYYFTSRPSPQDLLMFKHEGERLGCKWSLASKWTSFVALEEPRGESEPEGTTAVGESSNDIGLLRPRLMAKGLPLPLPKVCGVGAPVANLGGFGESLTENDSDEASEYEDINSDADTTVHHQYSYHQYSSHSLPAEASMSSAFSRSMRRSGWARLKHSTSISNRASRSCVADRAAEDEEAGDDLHVANYPGEEWVTNMLVPRRGPMRSHMHLEPAADVGSEKKGNRISLFRNLKVPRRFFKNMTFPIARESNFGPEEPTGIRSGLPHPATQEHTTDSTPVSPPARISPVTDLDNPVTTVATPAPNMDADETQRVELPPAKRDVPEGQEMQLMDAAAARELVKKLVRYQQSSGEFVFPSDDELKVVLGADFCSKLDQMRQVPPVIASTALVVALLEGQLESCRGLWLLMAAKAKTFVESQAAMLEGLTPAEVLSTAQRLVSEMRVLDLQEDGTVRGRRDSGEPVELLIAPVL